MRADVPHVSLSPYVNTSRNMSLMQKINTSDWYHHKYKYFQKMKTILLLLGLLLVCSVSASWWGRSRLRVWWTLTWNAWLYSGDNDSDGDGLTDAVDDDDDNDGIPDSSNFLLLKHLDIHCINIFTLCFYRGRWWWWWRYSWCWWGFRWRWFDQCSWWRWWWWRHSWWWRSGWWWRWKEGWTLNYSNFTCMRVQKFQICYLLINKPTFV